jgi:hypothetical protein
MIKITIELAPKDYEEYKSRLRIYSHDYLTDNIMGVIRGGTHVPFTPRGFRMLMNGIPLGTRYIQTIRDTYARDPNPSKWYIKIMEKDPHTIVGGIGDEDDF